MKKGKPQRLSADHTRKKILNAALKSFAKRGFSGTTTLEIAKAAKVNEALIFHHFENKTNLWRAVKEHFLGQLNLSLIKPQPKSLASFLDEIIKQRLEIYSNHPDFMRLIEWQKLEKTRAQLIGGNNFSPLTWLAPINYLKAQGKINTSLNSELIMQWLAASINVAISDDFMLFKDLKKQQDYIKLLKMGFEKSLK